MTKFSMTAAGYSALQDELNQRISVKRPRLIQRMQEAIADDSNLAENSVYHAAQEGQLKMKPVLSNLKITSGTPK